MPTLSVIAVRLALLYFAAGTSIGALLLASRAVALPGVLWALRPFHVEAVLFGFTVQLAVGVAYWMLPRAPGRVGERAMRAAIGLLNGGVLLASLSVPVLTFAGRMAEALALLTFAAHVWPRVRAARRV